MLRNRFLSKLVLLILPMLLAGQSAQVCAHAFAPALLEIIQNSSGNPRQFHISWKTPLKQAPRNELQLRFPAHCRAVSTPQVEVANTAQIMRWDIDCGDVGIINQTVGAEHIGSSGASVIVRIQLNDGRHYQAVLSPDNAGFVVPERLQAFAVFQSYTWLGMEHLWLGPDHLLFVVSLIVLIGFHRKLIWAITGFTLGHSVTLSLAALNLIEIPQALAETLIAFSLVLVAAEICRQTSIEHQGILSRFPIALTFTLGLVHGLGFAGALREIGLPQEAIPHALLAFNVGIEIAQLLGIFAIWLLLFCIRKILHRDSASFWETLQWKLPISVPIGTLAAFWFWQRLFGI